MSDERWQRIPFGPIVRDELVCARDGLLCQCMQRDLVAGRVLEWFSGLARLPYAMHVLLPEAVVLLIADIARCDPRRVRAPPARSPSTTHCRPRSWRRSALPPTLLLAATLSAPSTTFLPRTRLSDVPT